MRPGKAWDCCEFVHHSKISQAARLDFAADRILSAYSRRQQNQVVGVCTTHRGEWRHFPQCNFQRRVLHFPRAVSMHMLQEGQRANEAKAQTKASAESSCLGWNKQAWCHKDLHLWMDAELFCNILETTVHLCPLSEKSFLIIVSCRIMTRSIRRDVHRHFLGEQHQLVAYSTGES